MRRPALLALSVLLAALASLALATSGARASAGTTPPATTGAAPTAAAAAASAPTLASAAPTTAVLRPSILRSPRLAPLADELQISGLVTDAGDDKPLADVTVYLFTPSGELLGTVSTGPDGRYAFPDLEDTEYRIWFVDSRGQHLAQFYDGKQNLPSATPVRASASATAIDARMQRFGRIIGTIGTADPSADLSGVEVQVRTADGDIYTSTSTDESGRYDAFQVAPGTYHVVFAPPSADQVYVTRWWRSAAGRATATPVVVRSGETTGLDVQPLTPAASISGTVGPNLRRQVTEVQALDDHDRVVGTSATYNARSGEYRIPGLPAGVYRVRGRTGSSPVYAPGTYSDGAAAPVELTTGQRVTGIDIARPPSGNEIGVIGTLVTDQAVPVPDALVEAFDADSPQLRPVGYATTLEDGSYELIAPPGRYLIRFRASGRFAPAYADGESFAADTTAFVVAPDAPARADGVVRPGAEVTGTVTDASGPVEGAWVFLSAGEGPDRVDVEVPTSADGTYRARGLRPDDYQVVFSDYRTGERHEQARPVEVRDDATTTGVDHRFGGLGQVDGTVTRADGTPAAFARVRLHADSYNDKGIRTTADELGHYERRNLPPGEYRVAVEDPDGANATTWATADGGSVRAADARSYAVTPSGTTTVDVRMLPAASIAGVVRGPDGPLAYAQVEVLNAAGDVVQYTYAGEEGAYRVGPLRPGTYRVRFTSGGFDARYSGDAATFDAATPVTTSVDRPAEDVDATLVPSAVVEGDNVITGTVRDEDGQPVSDRYVEALTPDGDALLAAYVGADGRYRIEGLPAGSYVVGTVGGSDSRWLPTYHPSATTPAGATPVRVAGGETKDDVDLTLPFAASIGGRVTNAAGRPVAGVSVRTFAADGSVVGDDTWTGDDGYYRVRQLRAGAYRLRFDAEGQGYAPEFHQDAAGLDDATAVTVTGGQRRSGIDATLTPGGTVSGLVTDEAGAALPQAIVELLPTSEGASEGVRRRTDAQGRFRSGGLRPGDYRVRVDPPATRSDLTTELVRAGGTPATFTVTRSSAIAGADVQLRTGRSIAGRVTSGGAPLSDAVVEGRDADGLTVRAVTRPDGTYRLTGLAPGRWTVTFRGVGERHVARTYAPAGGGSGVPVGAADVQGVDGDLTEAGELSGTVRSEDGDVLPVTDDEGGTATVRVRALDGPDAVRTVSANPEGHWVLRGLTPGRYAVTFSAPGRVSQGYAGRPIGLTPTPVVVTAGQRRAGVGAELAVAGTVSGTVRREDGSPTAGVTVTALDAAGDPVATSVTGADGTYVLDAAPVGAVRLSFSAADLRTVFHPGKATLAEAEPVTVRSRRTTAGIDAVISPAPVVGPGPGDGGGTGTTPTTPATPSAPAVPGKPVPPAAPSRPGTPAPPAKTWPTGTLRLPSIVAVRRSGAFVVRIACPVAQRCRGTVAVVATLRGRRVVIGRATLRQTLSAVRLRLNPTGRRALQSARTLRATVTITPHGGSTPGSRKVVRLRAPEVAIRR